MSLYMLCGKTFFFVYNLKEFNMICSVVEGVTMQCEEVDEAASETPAEMTFSDSRDSPSPKPVAQLSDDAK